MPGKRSLSSCWATEVGTRRARYTNFRVVASLAWIASAVTCSNGASLAVISWRSRAEI